MRIAVTGATGFVGTPLVGSLVRAGHKVLALSRGVHPATSGVEWVRIAGLDDAGALAAAFTRADAVIHLAAMAHDLTLSSRDDASAFDRVNHLGTRYVAEAVRAAGEVRRLVVVSSVKAVTDSAPGSIDERYSPKPIDAYGRSKLDGERAAAEVLAGSTTELIVIRPPLVYGPGSRANVARIAGAVRRGLPLPIGNLAGRRSLIYIGNLTSALEQAAAHSGLEKGAYFVSDGVPMTAADMARAIGRSCGRPARIFGVPPSLLQALAGLGDLISRVAGRSLGLDSYSLRRLQENLVVDDSRFRAATGWHPPFEPERAFAEAFRPVSTR